MGLADVEIAVIGAGIGGLAVARALALHGARVTVFEQAPGISEIGAGIQISPNGFAVLKALGLADAITERSIRARAVNLIDYRGRPAARLDLGRLSSNEYHFLHRADLIDILVEGAGEAGVRLVAGAQVASITDQRTPSVVLADGLMHSSALVIGADGLHSCMREHLNGMSKPFFTGQVAWRTVIPAEGTPPPEARLYMGPHRHLVCYPLRDGTLMNIVAVEERQGWAPEDWRHKDDPQNLRDAFADFCAPVQRMLERVETVHLWGLFRHEVASRWFGMRTVLLGDAAHPTLPFMAQGASMALEDAWVLAECLANRQGLEAYQTRRIERVRKVVDAATGNAQKYHLSSPVVRWAAHTGLRIISRVRPSTLLNKYDWIYEHDVTREGA